MDIQNTMVTVMVCLGLIIAIQAVTGAVIRHIRQNGRRRFHGRKAEGERVKMKTMDLILAIMGAFLLAFIVAMIAVFVVCGAIPDSLVNGVFLLCGGECGVMGWIKNNKERSQLRKWELEDRKILGGTNHE